MGLICMQMKLQPSPVVSRRRVSSIHSLCQRTQAHLLQARTHTYSHRSCSCSVGGPGRTCPCRKSQNRRFCGPQRATCRRGCRPSSGIGGISTMAIRVDRVHKKKNRCWCCVPEVYAVRCCQTLHRSRCVPVALVPVDCRPHVARTRKFSAHYILRSGIQKSIQFLRNQSRSDETLLLTVAVVLLARYADCSEQIAREDKILCL